MQSFSAPIFKLGINPCVDVPEAVLKSLRQQSGKATGHIPVRGALNGKEFIQTVVKYKGEWRLYINGQMLKASGLEVGDEAKVNIEFDPISRKPLVNPSLAAAFQTNKAARDAFALLSPSRQHEVSRYLGSLQKEDSVNRNVERVLKHLTGEQTDALHALMRTKRD